MKKIIYIILTVLIVSCSSDVDDSRDADTTPPVITITGNSTLDVPQYVIYDDAGATATDDVDIDLTASIQVSGVLDTNTIGTYTINYSVSDSAGNSSSANRTVNVIDDGNSVYLDQNGVTIKAKSWANVGDTGVINGVTYTIVDETMLRQTISPNLVNQICTTKVTNMENIILDVMDVYSGAFVGDISTWDVSNVTTMRRMFWGDGFRDGFGFNQPIGDWDVSSVTDMTYMFQGAEVFNQPIGDWDVSSVTDMTFILGNAYSFNQPLSNWDVSNVTKMDGMFNNQVKYNQNLSSWDVENVTSCGNFSIKAVDWTLPRPIFTNCTP
ncbi:BspA family leucine-rich repeat surface protein [Polaribacter sp.]|nr:BspA family leucine-rich repeat surface protein [Polaribacter sp.]